ncbi:MAG: SRPBCC domain-containing protein [Saprospiraceae bacterium]|nr:SRPBCC domain-containing protein [Saprospiraceae bacterium]
MIAKTLFTENEIVIGAPVREVWDLLVNPEKTKLYMFGCEVVSDWIIGNPVLWKGSTDDVIYVKGNLVALDPEKRFAYTVIDPQGTYEDIPTNYLTVTYDVAPEGSHTRFRVTQGDYSSVAEGEKRFRDSTDSGGWQSVLEKIKELAEQLV